MEKSPFIRTPLTDLTAALLTHQRGGRCQDFEMNLVECLEAYGLDRGMKKCSALMRDFEECHTRRLQDKRFYAMRIERHRQHFAGEVKKQDKYAEPPSPTAY